MGSLPYVDKDNIGIWGWSYGGFNTLMSMSEGRPVFKAGEMCIRDSLHPGYMANRQEGLLRCSTAERLRVRVLRETSHD